MPRPGQLNLMTAGRGIAHSEESPPDRPPVLHGVQLWVALPAADRAVAPHFEHHPDLPGRAAGASGGSGGWLPLRPDFEYAVLALTGAAEVDGVRIVPGPLLYLGTGRSELAVRAGPPSRALLLGGEPFDERIVMWWNLVGRDHDEIVRARADWMAGRRFGTVHGYDGDPLPAPALPTTPLKPRGRHR